MSQTASLCLSLLICKMTGSLDELYESTSLCVSVNLLILEVKKAALGNVVLPKATHLTAGRAAPAPPPTPCASFRVLHGSESLLLCAKDTKEHGG